MPFPNFHTTCKLYNVAPWVPGSTPLISDIDCQQLRPFLPVDTQSQAGLLRPGIGFLYRIVCGTQWISNLDFNWRVVSVSNRWLLLDGMPAANMALKLEARTVYRLNGVLAYSYNILSLDLNPAIYP